MTVRLRFRSSSLRSTRLPSKALSPRAPARLTPRSTSDPNLVTPRELASGAASLLYPPVSLAIGLAFWRLGQDLGFAGHFFINDGPLSHWQVWFAVAGLLHLTGQWLKRRAGSDDDRAATS